MEGKSIPTIVGEPGHSSVKLLLSDLSASQIFENEPRTADWASVFEDRIHEQSRRDLAVMVPGARVEKVECRTSSCALRVELPGDAEPDLLIRALQVAPLGDGIAIEGFDRKEADGKWRGTLYSMFDQNRDPERQSISYSVRRKDALQRLKPGHGRLRGIDQIPRE